MNWTTTKKERDLIAQISARAARLFRGYNGGAVSQDHLEMDITATHLNGCPLDLPKLLAAPDGVFAHDVGGIVIHLDRRTGALGDCFLPRYAA